MLLRRQGAALRWYAPTALAAVFLVAQGSPAWAWGPHGHRIVAKFAMTRMNQNAKAALFDLLEDGEDLADASTWPDEHKRQIKGSAFWHYVNVPIAEAEYDDRFCDMEKSCVVEKIPEFLEILKDKSKSDRDRLFALRFIVHLVGDIHQPLHVADDDDEGGNGLHVRYFRRSTNLHRIWDSEIIAHAKIGGGAGIRDIDEIASGQSIDEGAWVKALSRFAKGKESAWVAEMDVKAWATESLQSAKTAYRFQGGEIGIDPGEDLGKDYQKMAEPIVRERLAKAGARLAVLLNEALGGDDNP